MPITGEGAQNILAYDETGNVAFQSYYTDYGFDTMQRDQQALLGQVGALQQQVTSMGGTPVAGPGATAPPAATPSASPVGTPSAATPITATSANPSSSGSDSPGAVGTPRSDGSVCSKGARIDLRDFGGASASAGCAGPSRLGLWRLWAMAEAAGGVGGGVVPRSIRRIVGRHQPSHDFGGPRNARSAIPRPRSRRRPGHAPSVHLRRRCAWPLCSAGDRPGRPSGRGCCRRSGCHRHRDRPTGPAVDKLIFSCLQPGSGSARHPEQQHGPLPLRSEDGRGQLARRLPRCPPDPGAIFYPLPDPQPGPGPGR